MTVPMPPTLPDDKLARRADRVHRALGLIPGVD